MSNAVKGYARVSRDRPSPSIVSTTFIGSEKRTSPTMEIDRWPGTAMLATSLFMFLLSILTAFIGSTSYEIPFEYHGTLTVNNKYVANLLILLFNVNFDVSRIYHCSKYINITLYNLNQSLKINVQIHNLRNNSLTVLELYTSPRSIIFSPPYDTYLIVFHVNGTNTMEIYVQGIYTDFPFRCFTVFSFAFLIVGMFLLALYTFTRIESKVRAP